MNFKIKELEGRPHWVVPCVLGVEGVWNGSRGSLLYTANDLAKSASLWCGKPVVVYHPQMSLSGIAGDPAIFSRQKIGTIFNARFDRKSRALKAECWIDPQRAAAVDERVLDAIKNGDVMEVSTGLFTDNEPVSGTFNGRGYVAIARSHLPDHLAILPDQQGACSVEMGAGLCRNAWLGVEPLGLPELMFA
ncbi:MAG: DUF2213 domain-containing protein [Tepidisphaeraceae bacterium]|jgi:hypothetical protein